jgi:hypothetical protein
MGATSRGHYESGLGVDAVVGVDVGLNVSNSEVRIFGCAATIPNLRIGGPTGQVDANTGRVLKLQLQIKVCPALHGDVVLAGLNAHGSSLRCHNFVRMPGGEVGSEAPFVGKVAFNLFT